LINNPSVVLADEPSGNLDSDNSRQLHKLFFKLRDDYNQTLITIAIGMLLLGRCLELSNIMKIQGQTLILPL